MTARYRRWAGWPWWYDVDGQVYVVDDFGSLVPVKHDTFDVTRYGN
jgi:hypothetical protein